MSPGLTSPEPASATHTVGRWGVAALLTLCFTLAYVDRQVISLLVAPIKADLGLSDTEVGLLQGISFSLFYVAASIPLAWLADRYSRARIMGGCIVVWSLSTMLCGLVSNFHQLLGARVGVAAGEAGLPPSALTVLSNLFDARRLAVATSIFMLSPFLGGGIALMGGGVLYEASAHWNWPELPGIGPLERWQQVFVVVGMPGVFAGLMVWLLVPDLRASGPATRRTDAPNLLGWVRSQRRFFVNYILAISLTSMLLSTYVAWLPAAMMRNHGANEAQVGAVFGPSFLLCGAAGALFAGLLLSRAGGRAPVGSVVRFMRRNIALLVPFAIIAPQMPSLMLEALTFGVAIFLISSIISMSSLPLQFAVPDGLRAQAIAVMGLASALIGTGLGPVFAGILSDLIGSEPRALSLALSLIGGLTVPMVWMLLGAALGSSTATRTDDDI